MLILQRLGRPVLYLGMVGLLLSCAFDMAVLFWWHIFPLYLIFVGPFFSIIGGGNAVLLAMVYAIIADISDEKDRYRPLVYGQALVRPLNAN